MEKLNELVELAKKATPGKWWIDSHGQVMVAFSGEDGVQLVFATNNTMGPLVRHEDTGNLSHWRNDNDATFIAAANPETILAIAAAFRALEQEKEAAEAKLQAEREISDIIMESLRQKEAKLAELKKQKPCYQIQKKPSYGRESVWIDVASREEAETNVLHGYRWRMVYDAPAPAADLAELVPGEMFMSDAVYANLPTEWMDGFNACRATLLSNIEEAK